MRVAQWLVAALLSACLGLYLLETLTLSTSFQFFGRLVSHVQTTQKIVALTFDDGPNSNTEQLLAVLERNRVKATFFMIGENVERYPDSVRMIVGRGHEVGNHSYTHTYRYLERPSVAREEIERTDALLRSLGATGEINFRAPFGRKLIVLPYVLQKMGKRNVLWDVDPHDYEDPDHTILSRRIGERVSAGSIILLHDRPNTTQALQEIISDLRNQGYSFATVNELIKLSPES